MPSITSNIFKRIFSTEKSTEEKYMDNRLERLKNLQPITTDKVISMVKEHKRNNL